MSLAKIDVEKDGVDCSETFVLVIPFNALLFIVGRYKSVVWNVQNAYIYTASRAETSTVSCTSVERTSTSKYRIVCFAQSSPRILDLRSWKMLSRSFGTQSSKRGSAFSSLKKTWSIWLFWSSTANKWNLVRNQMGSNEDKESWRAYPSWQT